MASFADPTADWTTRASGADALIQGCLDRLFDGFAPGHRNERTFTPLSRYVFHAFLDFGFDLRDNLGPRIIPFPTRADAPRPYKNGLTTWGARLVL
jgi:hypothetical protein